MKTLTFPCHASSGKLDSTEWEWNFEVSDDEYIRLKRAAEEADSMEDCPNIADIYDKLISEMISEQADVYFADDDLLEEVMDDLELDEDDDISKEQIIEYLQDRYTWGIDFPDELSE